MNRLVPLAVVLALAGATVAHAAKKPPTGPLTGSINVTCSLGQCQNVFGWTCNQTVALDSVTINMDVPAGANGKARDAFKIDPGCTGTIGTVTISTNGGDGIKVADGVHDLTIGPGTVTCSGRYADVHQDGVQVMGGSHITFTGLSVDCPTANDAQLRIVMAGAATVPPDAVVCDGCSFRPGVTAYHDVTVGASTNSGVSNSTICPSVSPNLTFDTRGSTNPVNFGNVFPEAC